MRCWIRYFLIGLGALVVILYFAVSYVVYDRLSHIDGGYGKFESNDPSQFTVIDDDFEELDTTPYFMNYFEEVEFPSREEGIQISGWFVPSESSRIAKQYSESDDPVKASGLLNVDTGKERAIILIHGRGESKASHKVLVPAGMLHNAGFNVFLIDLRDHGLSTIEDSHFAVGSEEYLDVLGALDWLVTKKGFLTKHVGLYGLSLGAAVAINAAGEEPAIQAVFSDSSFADIHTIIDEELSRNGIPTFISTGAIWWAKIIANDDLLKFSPIEQLAKLKGRHLFITQGSSDTRIHPHHGVDLFKQSQKVGVKSSGWFIRDADHADTMLMMPDEYEKKLVEFFNENLSRKAGRVKTWELDP